jgi:hypothetical protein
MADAEIKASKEPARNNYGQNGSPLPSSLTPEQHKSPIADVSPPTVAAPSLRVEDTLAHRVKMDGDKPAAITTHSGMSNRSTSIESIPHSTVRRDSGKRI